MTLRKFRAWDKERNEMFHVGDIYINLKGKIFLDMLKYKITDDRFVIMQFTGLTDKNNKEIYEGDIFRADNGKLWIVQYSSTEFAFVVDCLRFMSRPFSEHMTLGAYIQIDHKYYEVIGNRHDNPELLEKETRKA